MKKLIIVAALVAPIAALASIESSAHNFAAATTRAVASADQQICKYCHTPHGALTDKQVLWNHQDSSKGYSWGTNTSTWAGTSLPTAMTESAKRCLACHDGTIALGSVHNVGGNANPGAGFSTVAFQGNVDALGLLVGNNKLPDLAGNHPVGIPYPGSATGSYNGKTSAVDSTKVGQPGYYKTATTSGSHKYVGTLPLARPAGTGATEYGVECATCHNPHNTENQVYLLRLPLAGSQICLNCHLK